MVVEVVLVSWAKGLMEALADLVALVAQTEVLAAV